MNTQKNTTEFLLEHCAAYPALQPQDLLKALHQSVFGCGHFVTEQAAAFLQEELRTLPPSEGPFTEDLDGSFCRVHLRTLKNTALSPETLFRLFSDSAAHPDGSTKELEEKLAVLANLARSGQLPFSFEAVSAAIDSWRKAGFPPQHHSAEFREAYHPAYRVIRKDYLRWLPLLTATDALLATRDRVLIAIEGGSASGKTTLSALLQKFYDCTVLHMDDFFLQPHQRTAERLATPGENIDHERFLQQVLQPIQAGLPVQYSRYDCCTQTLLSPLPLQPKHLMIVEGAYSMHPQLAEYYDFSVFLQITPELQRSRILQRNDPKTAERFFSTWIPMEHLYFQTMDTATRCDLILEVDT